MSKFMFLCTTDPPFFSICFMLTQNMSTRPLSISPGIFCFENLSRQSFAHCFTLKQYFYKCVWSRWRSFTSSSFITFVRSSSGNHGLLHTQQPTFSNFSNSSDSKVKEPNMCNIFEKHGIQGYRICIKCKIHKYTITLIRKYTNTQIQSA